MAGVIDSMSWINGLQLKEGDRAASASSNEAQHWVKVTGPCVRVQLPALLSRGNLIADCLRKRFTYSQFFGAYSSLR